MRRFLHAKGILLAALGGAALIVAAAVLVLLAQDDDEQSSDGAGAPTPPVEEETATRSPTPPAAEETATRSPTPPAVPTPSVTATPPEGGSIPRECLVSSAPPVSTPAAGTDSLGLVSFITGDLVVMRPDGSEMRKLTSVSVGPGRASFQKWSPDGQRIAFVAPGRNSETGIYVISPDGTDQRWVTDVGATSSNVELAWSPAGDRIAFSYWPRGEAGRPENPRIHVANVDGSGSAELTDGSAPDLSPDWSPDGTRIAFVSERDGNREIYVMNADGSGQTRLTNHPLEDDEPSWSPDGQAILFVSNRDVDPQLRATSPSLYVPEIYVMNPDGTDQRNLSNNAEHDDSPAWSPDGDRIAFVSGRDGNAEIYVMRADGSEQRRLTDYPCVDGPASWSPDGRQLAFTRWFHEPTSGEATADIFVIDLDGGNEARLTDDPGWDWLPAWSPR